LESRDAAEALRSGADDAIIAPFDYDELEARLERLLPHAESDGDLSCYPLLVRPQRREIFARGQRLDLRPAEYLLLEHLMQHQPHVVSSCQLLAEVFGTRAKSGTLRFHICTLRKKLSLFEADVIHTVRCHGYFVAPLVDS
jgi:DNA-binding response OmpR family regulator